ncbi:MAG TPA: N-6 DNA methylase, partial [Accumulibacter sp.]|nr:N-6 DNA methylase [Accumulibacter sp.]
MVLVPTDERRRTGSHYTPRALTGPIVRKTLEPVLRQLGDRPTPDQILNLKVCDPAMGSGAFLVEACRQLASALVEAWAAHGWKPYIPPDTTEELHAQRLVAQRCLYGVDRNPMAVDLAKLSLWLATLARDLPFTFLDHALRTGDSLVGLTRLQIMGFHWAPEQQPAFLEARIRECLEKVTRTRRQILDAGDNMPPGNKRQILGVADEQLDTVRLLGDAVVSAFFHGGKKREREERLVQLFVKAEDRYIRNDFAALLDLKAAARELRTGAHPVTPFHWEAEFPEVFAPDRGGFDAIVGNPPFAGKNTLINGNRAGYLDWLQTIHEEAHGNSDLVAHFFRRAFGLLRPDGAFGLIATNTIGQGDTRHTGLRWICTHGGTIYAATKRYKWPGLAAVVVSVVHVAKGEPEGPFELDGRAVPVITAYLFHAGGHDTPATLHANAGKSYIGSYVLGMGFTFDDTDKKGVANPISLMHELIAKDPRNAERIFPYLGGEEVNTSPTHAHHRYVINFEDFPLRRAELQGTWKGADEQKRTAWLRTGIVPLDYPDPVAADWPDLLAIVEAKVKPQRNKDKREVRRKYWWRFGETTPALFAAIAGLERVLTISRVS